MLLMCFQLFLCRQEEQFFCHEQYLFSYMKCYSSALEQIDLLQSLDAQNLFFYFV
jgi:hypothetical protein